MSDAAQNIAPSLKDKKIIIANAVDYFHRLGVANPKIAIIAAIEAINTKMEATTDAALLTMMNHRNQIKGCIVDGPLAIDVALSKEAAKHKGLEESPVVGNADFLLVPSIEVGNVFYKSLVYMGGATAAGILLGAKVPIVLTSRSDTDRIKMLSIAMAVAY
jgi:phosphate butyryltransferase